MFKVYMVAELGFRTIILWRLGAWEDREKAVNAKEQLEKDNPHTKYQVEEIGVVPKAPKYEFVPCPEVISGLANPCQPPI